MFFKDRFLQFLVLSLLAILLFHLIATIHYLYWKYKYLDTILHFLGGVWLGLAVIWYGYYSNKISLPKKPLIFTIIIVLSFTSLVGVLWEFFEFFINEYVAIKIDPDIVKLDLKDNSKDTFSDLFSALFGSLISSFILLKRGNAKQG